MTNAITPDARQGRVSLERLEYLDSFCRRLTETEDKHDFIAIRVTRGDKTIFNGLYGSMYDEAGEQAKPLADDAIYPLRSLSKPFTAAAAAILQEDGEIDWWDPVQKYLPEFQGDGKGAISVWQLLSHSSGMDSDAHDAFYKKWWEDEAGGYPRNVTRDKLFELYSKAAEKLGTVPPADGDDEAAMSNIRRLIELRAPIFVKPETRYSYYSFGYQIISEILEKITGETLEQYSRRRIFDPLGMDDTWWFLPAEKRARYACRSNKSRAYSWMNGEREMENLSSDAGLKSSIRDLTTFGQLFLRGGTLHGKRILSPSTVRLMTKDMNSKLPESEWLGRMFGSNWGLGWDVKNGKKDDLGMLRSDRSYNHAGYGGARLLIDPDEDMVVAFYVCERDEFSFYDDMSRVINVLYSALD